MRVSWSRYHAYKRGIKNGDTLVSSDPYHTGFCDRRYESFEDKAVELLELC